MNALEWASAADGSDVLIRRDKFGLFSITISGYRTRELPLTAAQAAAVRDGLATLLGESNGKGNS